jgi:hypothetical protein
VVSRKVSLETQVTQEVSRKVSLEMSLKMSRFPMQEIPQELTHRWPQDLTHY